LFKNKYYLHWLAITESGDIVNNYENSEEPKLKDDSTNNDNDKSDLTLKGLSSHSNTISKKDSNNISELKEEVETETEEDNAIIVIIISHLLLNTMIQ